MHAIAKLFPQVEPWWFAFGLLAQAVFFMRFFMQWLASEREKKSTVPTSFWYLSLAGGISLMAYAIHQRDPVFAFGQGTGLIIYLRNIVLIDRRRGKWLAAAAIAVAATIAAAVLSVPGAAPAVKATRLGTPGSVYWVAFGFFAQAFFFGRFFVQWLASEREKKSVMPTSFWYMSLGGGLLLSLYALHRQDPVFFIGQVTGVVIYLRNLIFIHGTRGKDLSYATILVFLTFTLFVVKNDVPALWGSSEARAAEIAREMYVTGDYILPHLNGSVALTKPPLYHWLAATSYSLFGIDESTARFPSAAAGILAILMTYVLGRKMFGSTTGFLAAATTASCISFMGCARAARTDMVFTFLIVASITAFFYATQSQRRAKLLYVLSFIIMGLAVMAKGPAGVFLPLLSGTAYLYFSGGKARLKEVPWLACAAALLAVVLPWHIVAGLAGTPEERRYYFWGQMARWATTQGGGTKVIFTSFLLYVPLILAGFFPWSFFLPGGLAVAYRGVRDGRARQLILPFVWFLVGLTAFSFSSTKQSRYMVPMLPAAGLMVAYLWHEGWKSLQRAAPDAKRAPAHNWLRGSVVPLAITSAVAAALVLAGSLLAGLISHQMVLSRVNSADAYQLGIWQRFLTEYRVDFIVVTLAIAVLCGGAALAIYRRRLVGGFICLTGAAMISLLLYQFSVVPKVDEIYNVKPFVAEASRLSDGGPFAWTGVDSMETVFYGARIIEQVRPQGVKRFLESDPRALVLILLRNPKPTRLPRETLDFARVLYKARFKHDTAILLAPPGRPGAAELPLASTEILESAPSDAAPSPLQSTSGE